MSNDTNSVNRYIGMFTILDEELSGEVIYDKHSGTIILNLAKQLDERVFFGKSYAKIPVIYGQINTGAVVTLYNNNCINNHTQAGQAQRIYFSSEYLIWSNTSKIDAHFNELVCTIKNAFFWSQLSVFEKNGFWIKYKEEQDIREFNWFGMKVVFSVYSNENFWSLPDYEEKTLVQRVRMSISNKEKKSLKEFITVRDKIIALISFAVKNNVNVDEEYLVDFDDNPEDRLKHYLLSARRELEVYDSYIWDYYFTMNQLPTNKDINEELEKLVPIFNMYLSLFKYRDMPIEMIFLNIVQALETFHSRFFYNDKKKNYVESVVQRFSNSGAYDFYKKKLLSDTQMDENCNYIILVSRLNDLLIGNDNPLFYEYWRSEDDYAQVIADTRHYYTHYSSAKEKKALKGDDLRDSIYVLSRLLEYHICNILGIDIEGRIRRELKSHESWKQLEKTQNRNTIDNS